QLSNHKPAARPHCETHGNLLLARGRAHQKQVRDISAANEQHHSDDTQQKAKRLHKKPSPIHLTAASGYRSEMRVVFGLKLTDRLLSSRSALDLPCLAVLECGLLKRKIKRCLRLLDRHAWFQSAHYSEPPVTSAHELRTITID